MDKENIEILEFHAYTLQNNPHTHLSIWTRYTDIDFEIVVRLGGGSRKAKSLIKFMMDNLYLYNLKSTNIDYMIKIGAIPLRVLTDWINQYFDFTRNPSPFDVDKFTLLDLGEEYYNEFDQNMTEEQKEYYYQTEIEKQNAKQGE